MVYEYVCRSLFKVKHIFIQNYKANVVWIIYLGNFGDLYVISG